MKTLLTVLLFLATPFASAQDSYQCRGVQRTNGFDSSPLEIKRSFLSGTIKEVRFFERFRTDEPEEATNPFLSDHSKQFGIDRRAIEESKRHRFIQFTGTGIGRKYLTISRSILEGKSTGLVHYYSETCLIDCTNYSYFFECSKN